MRERAIAILVGLWCLVTSHPSEAGPPLLSDDPHTVGPGVFQGIVAVAGFELDGVAGLQAPFFDLSLGVVDGLDLVLTAGPTHNFGTDIDVDIDGNLLGGVKWQFIRRERWNVAFTPAVGVDLVTGGEVVVILPLQVEYTADRFSVGVDTGYFVVSRAPDQWIANLYCTAGPWRNVTFLAELWSFGLPGEGAYTGINAGVDWQIPFELHVLAAAGTGIAAARGERARWVAYLGLQRDFTLWRPRRGR